MTLVEMKEGNLRSILDEEILLRQEFQGCALRSSNGNLHVFDSTKSLRAAQNSFCGAGWRFQQQRCRKER